MQASRFFGLFVFFYIMRSEAEVREVHRYFSQACKQANANGTRDEAVKLAWSCHALIWVLGHGEIFATVVETVRKAQDDGDLDVLTLE